MSRIDDLTGSLNKYSIALIALGVVLGAAVGTLGSNLNNVDGEAAAQQLVSTLEQSTGGELEVIGVETQNGLYRVQIRDQNDQLSTYYLTKDGSMVMQENGMTDFQNYRQQVSLRSDFTSCMADRGVVMFGNQSQRGTLAQIQLLGGANMVSGIYADVNNNQTLQQAAQVGVQALPSFYYNDSVAQGVQTVDQLESFTGCTYNTTE